MLLAVVLLTIATPRVEAKVLPQTKGVKAAVRSAGGSSFAVSARLLRNKNAVSVAFSNLQNVTSVMYTLSYQTSGREEGAGGTISQTEGSTSRELYFGTCSGYVCRPHGNITNARLEIQSQLKNGKTSIRRYKIRV
ncbi:hypothetical protein HYW66_01315 [Candidatus Microgenomates bacterium]|nr:hypothetical protein [Candidatus Microgenomates bacterium]